MKFVGVAPQQITNTIQEIAPNVAVAIIVAHAVVGVLKAKREIALYQAAALYALTQDFDEAGCNILEIGTALGFSAAVIAQAAPAAHVVTLNPNADECKLARKNLASFKNVEVKQMKSIDYLVNYSGPKLDMVFVDGDHARVAFDFPWFNWLTTGGLMLFHDYSPSDTPRACPPVYDGLNHMAAALGHVFDVLIVDDTGVGMAGFYRKEGEEWHD